MQLEDFKQKAELIRSNEVYDVYDLNCGHLKTSVTVLHPYMETKGHSHDDADEIYYIIQGYGLIRIGDESKPFRKGDILPIPRGVFHKVFSHSTEDVILLCVFEKYGERV